MRHVVAALTVAAFLGCANDLAPTNDVSGTWDGHFTLPGAALVLNLAESGGDLTGNGSYVIEAGRSGTLQLAGTYTRPRISLVFHYDYGPVNTYTGTVQGDRLMSGTLGAAPLTFTRR